MDQNSSVPFEIGSSPNDHSSYRQVVGIGNAVMDYLGLVKKMPCFDDPESVKAEEWAITGGGPVSTALATLARFRVPVSYIGILGNDLGGIAVRDDFIREGVDVSHLQLRTDVRTPSSLVLVESGTGRRAYISFRCEALKSSMLTPEDHTLIRSAKYLHLDGWHPGLGIPAAYIAREAGVKVSLDAYQVDDQTQEWVRLTDILIATETFPGRYTGENDISVASDILLSQGPGLVVVTLGERGCYLATKEQQFYQPGFSVKVVDMTGAGDVFHGAFLYGLIQNWDLARIARFANAAGALKCTRFAGRAGIPTITQVEEFLERR